MSLWPPREHWRRLTFGLLTVAGIARRGIFIPYRYAADLPPPGQRPPHEAIATLMAARAPAFRRVLAAVDRQAAALSAIGYGPAPAPRWRQGWFPPIDAAVAYTLVRRLRPRLLIEVGSGHSTRFFSRAVADAGLATRILAIDPAPRAPLAGLDIELITATVQTAGLAPFERLQAGDVLSIDSSHILMPGSDVDFLLNQVLPGLTPGVVVHIHDIFLPDDYPPAWAWRAYNEQLGVAAMLHGGSWRVLWSSRYVTTRLPELLQASLVSRLPRCPGAEDSSLWLVRMDRRTGRQL